MRMSIELVQSWETSEDIRNYLRSLSRVFESFIEMGDEAPTDWYFSVTEDKKNGEYKISLTHL